MALSEQFQAGLPAILQRSAREISRSAREAGSGRKAEGQIRGASHDVNADPSRLFSLK
jgi:hypothetical protein